MKKKQTIKNKTVNEDLVLKEPTNAVLLKRLNEINKKLDKLLFTQEVVDRLINCDEAKFTDTIPIKTITSKNNVNFDDIMGAKDFEDLFPKTKICKKLKTNVPKK